MVVSMRNSSVGTSITSRSSPKSLIRVQSVKIPAPLLTPQDSLGWFRHAGLCATPGLNRHRPKLGCWKLLELDSSVQMYAANSQS